MFTEHPGCVLRTLSFTVKQLINYSQIVHPLNPWASPEMKPTVHPITHAPSKRSSSSRSLDVKWRLMLIAFLRFGWDLWVFCLVEKRYFLPLTPCSTTPGLSSWFGETWFYFNLEPGNKFYTWNDLKLLVFLYTRCVGIVRLVDMADAKWCTLSGAGQLTLASFAA